MKAAPGGTPDGDDQGGGVFMIIDRLRRLGADSPVPRFAAIAVATILVAACAAPGAVTSPSAAASVAPPSAAPSASVASEAPSASAAAGPTCGTEPVTLNAYFETGFDIPFKLSEEFTKQYPNVTWDIKQDQFTNLMTATPRLLRAITRPT
jgi:raffinose/stachyose/melibiose transport system substrate-binding protein